MDEEEMAARDGRSFAVQVNMTAEEYAAFAQHCESRIPRLNHSTFVLISIFEKIDRDLAQSSVVVALPKAGNDK